MGSVTDVGLYQAANSITNQYVGLVFSAMAIDYFPRLAAVQNDKNKQNEIVNQQTEIVLLIVAPLASLLIITSPLLIKILLTENFYSIINVIRWMGLAIFFKAMAFPMGYISYSKGDKKTFFWFEGILGNIIQLTFGCFLYYQYGLLGLGVSYLLTYIYGVLAYIVLTKKKYCFQFEKEVIKLIAVLSVFMALIFISSFIANAILSYTLMLVFLIVLSAFCLLELNKRIDIKGMLSRFKPHRVSDQNEH
jgi:O-antigen/teichoic acid export membrane protein